MECRSSPPKGDRGSRPGGATECSHGWSGAAAQRTAAQPVETRRSTPSRPDGAKEADVSPAARDAGRESPGRRLNRDRAPIALAVGDTNPRLTRSARPPLSAATRTDGATNPRQQAAPKGRRNVATGGAARPRRGPPRNPWIRVTQSPSRPSGAREISPAINRRGGPRLRASVRR